MYEKDYTWNPSKSTSKNDIYLEVIWDEIIKKTKTVPTKTILSETVPTNFNEKMVDCKMKNLSILLVFLLNTRALLITVSIYFYLIKHRSKQKQLLPYHDTSNKFKGININNII